MTRATTIDEKAFNTLLSTITKALLGADVDFAMVAQLQKNIRAKVNISEEAAQSNLKKLIHTTVIHEMYKLLDSGGSTPYQLRKGKSNVIMFVGLQGSGKTTTVSKYAHYYQKRGWKVGVVCADTYRAGAFDQLKQNATKAKIPFYGSYTELDPVVVAEAGVAKFKKEKFEIIIIDTSGRHKQEAALFEEMQEVAKVTQPDDVVFVMDSSIGKSAKDQAMAFRSAVDVGSVIITKLDGHAKGGGALSAVAATKAPIVFVGTGEHIVDFEPFNSKSFVSRLLGMGDITGLLSMLEEQKIDQQELVKKIVEGKGNFSFKDMRDQFQNLMKLGPLSQVMSMLPNLGFNLNAANEKESTSRIRRFVTIIDSMNNKELECDTKLFTTQPSRAARIARGSGSSPKQVQELMDAFKPFQKVAEKLSQLTKSGIDPTKFGPGLVGQKGRQAQQNMQQLASMFDPKMLQRMGGAGNLQKMMQSLAQGGMPNIPGMPKGMKFPGMPPM